MNKEFVTWEKFEEGVTKLASGIKKEKIIPEAILTIPRGGLTIAATLAHKLGIKDIIFTPEEADRKYCYILLVDDVADSGETLLRFFPKTCKCKMVTLHYKPCSKVKPDFFAFETDKWVVYPWEEDDIK